MNKATELADKAGELHDAVDEIVQAAKSGPLRPLQELAGQLKDAAGNQDSGSGLHQAANQLATKKNQPAESEADGVIGAFDNVETKYEALMKAAKESGLTNYPEVTSVVKAYHSVKNIYYQMLIGYRFRYLIGTGIDGMILNKAKDLYEKADSLANAGGLQPKGDTQKDLKEQLKQLAEVLKNATDDTGQGLQQALNGLRGASEKNGDEQIATNALAAITKYKEVKDAYEKVTAREMDYTSLANPEYDPVKTAFEALETAFDALKKSYVNVLKLRVQELSQKADTLKTKADELKSVPPLSDTGRALKEAASQPSGGEQQGLKEKATKLVEAINNPSGSDNTKASEVITQFEAVTTRYDELTGAAKGLSLTPEQKQSVKEVDDAYNNLKEVYNKILNFTKIKHYSNEVESKAKLITDPGTVKQFKEKYEAFGKIYSSIPDDQADIKSTVQNDFESIKNVVYGAQFDEK